MPAGPATCKVCGHEHWIRDPHVFPREAAAKPRSVSPEPPRVASPVTTKGQGVTTKGQGVTTKAPPVTTEGYERHQPNPRRYATAAERQRAYRLRKQGAQDGMDREPGTGGRVDVGSEADSRFAGP
jgi:hypothetical protein